MGDQDFTELLEKEAFLLSGAAKVGKGLLGAGGKALGNAFSGKWTGKVVDPLINKHIANKGARTVLKDAVRGAASDAVGFGVLTGGMNAAMAEDGERLSAGLKGFGEGLGMGAAYGAVSRPLGNALKRGRINAVKKLSPGVSDAAAKAQVNRGTFKGIRDVVRNQGRDVNRLGSGLAAATSIPAFLATDYAAGKLSGSGSIVDMFTGGGGHGDAPPQRPAQVQPNYQQAYYPQQYPNQRYKTAAEELEPLLSNVPSDVVGGAIGSAILGGGTSAALSGVPTKTPRAAFAKSVAPYVVGSLGGVVGSDLGTRWDPEDIPADLPQDIDWERIKLEYAKPVNSESTDLMAAEKLAQMPTTPAVQTALQTAAASGLKSGLLNAAQGAGIGALGGGVAGGDLDSALHGATAGAGVGALAGLPVAKKIMETAKSTIDQLPEGLKALPPAEAAVLKKSLQEAGDAAAPRNAAPLSLLAGTALGVAPNEMIEQETLSPVYGPPKIITY